MTPEEVAGDWPVVTVEDVLAAIRYAADQVQMVDIVFAEDALPG